jgi:DNA-binding beta-propeller fold protein YncE
VYVADYAAGMVQIYSTDGMYVGHFPSDEQDLKIFGPDGFSPYDVHLYGERVVVSSNDGLYFFDIDGRVVDRWGGRAGKGESARGNGWGEFNFPDAFTIDRETGTFYVADTMNRRVVAIDADGNWLWASGRSDVGGDIKSFWQLPRGIALGPDGKLYVVDTFRPDVDGMGTGHIVVLSKEGALLSEFGRTGAEDGAFSFPEHIAKGPDDLWALADRENHRIVIFRLLTPYPPVDDTLARRYPKGFSDQEPAG